VAVLRKCVEVDPRFAAGHLFLGTMLHDSGRDEEALPHLLKALELKSQLPPAIASQFAPVAYNSLGNALQARRRHAEAEAAYRQALELDPKHVHAYNGLGNALRGLRRDDEAIAAYHKAIELDPKYALPHNNLANALRAQGRSDEAVSSYRKAIEIDPKYA